ncbi:hypothetical protein SEA_FRANKLIN22_69 [Microbacterium phage Franklin22]|uniref:hypothetical protein n=1 Tax=Microbacterium phage Franklin22 TaxID=2894293 RepID=UPI001E6C5D97|nr:hypothetical protein QDW15_gp69 [Microbacterium phage Franklin22]UGL61882.1 hypothetical protein SEA_FRANKLIN22_69 [Microbacterium phage Franklin22]
MAKLVFAARVLYGPGEAKPDAPERVDNPLRAYVVRNPYTGHKLWLRSDQVVNVINGVAAVLMEANRSGRYPTQLVRRGTREYINPLTGNTFQVSTQAVIKENA